MARYLDTEWKDLEPVQDERDRLRKSIPMLHAQMLSESARIRRLETYLQHANHGAMSQWREEEIWDEARELRVDEYGDHVEIASGDEEEEEWRAEHPRCVVFPFGFLSRC